MSRVCLREAYAQAARVIGLHSAVQLHTKKVSEGFTAYALLLKLTLLIMLRAFSAWLCATQRRAYECVTYPDMLATAWV